MTDLVTMLFEDAVNEAEKRRETEIAKNLLHLNVVRLEDIATATNLSIDALQTLKAEMGQ